MTICSAFPTTLLTLVGMVTSESGAVMTAVRARLNLLEVTILMFVVCVGSIAAQAQDLKTILSFGGNDADGEVPLSPPLFDSGGTIYGTTTIGGTSLLGTVFKLSPKGNDTWTESVLHDFSGSDGQQPNNVIFGKNGSLYDTTVLGGSQNCYQGCGTIFQLTPDQNGWTLDTLYEFQGFQDGQAPGNVQLGRDGSLYGTTPSGGPPFGRCQKVGCGTLFQLSKKNGVWTKTILHGFPATTTDGRNPNADIIFDSHGNIYGTTYAGGSLCYGTVFQLSPPTKKGGAWTETVLHNFSGGSDGGYPIGGLTLGSDGSIYGTGSYSGVPNQSGTVFKLKPPAKKGRVWAYAVLHTFDGDKYGATPATTMAFDTKGNLYGTAWNGGSTACNDGCGLVFKLQPVAGKTTWKETVLRAWPNSGQAPNGSIVIYNDGLLYGTTLFLGADNVGSVFTLTP